MNGKQLKNSILQWAIQGKLVPQDPNDEPASMLLERIRTEKAKLVKEKKIKIGRGTANHEGLCSISSSFCHINGFCKV